MKRGRFVLRFLRNSLVEINERATFRVRLGVTAIQRSESRLGKGMAGNGGLSGVDYRAVSAFYVRFLSPLLEAMRALTELIPQSAKLGAENGRERDNPTGPSPKKTD